MGRGANDCILQFLGDPDWRLELNKSLNIDRISKCMKFDGELCYSTIDDVVRKIGPSCPDG